MTKALIGDSNLLDVDFDINDSDQGRLTSTNRVSLDTLQAKRLFNGHVSNRNRNSMAFGIKQIGYNMNMMMISIRGNDPYGDYYFYEIEQRLIEGRLNTKTMIEYYQTRAQDSVPDGFAMSKATSVKPTVIDVRSSNPLFFQMLFWLLEIDTYISLVSSMKHLGLILPKKANEIIAKEENAFRSLTHFIRSYQITGVTRDDFAANNARVATAKEKMKHIDLPDEILTGELRSEYAPEITPIKNEEVVRVKNLGATSTTVSSKDTPPISDTNADSSTVDNIEDTEAETQERNQQLEEV